MNLTEFLFLDNLPIDENLVSATWEVFFSIAPFFAIFACLIIIYSSGDIVELAKRGMWAILILSVAHTLQKSLYDAGVEIAGNYFSLIAGENRYFGSDQFWTSYSRYKDEILKDQESPWFALPRFMGSFFAVESALMQVVRYAVMASVIINKIIYTLVYYLNLVLLPIPLAISLLPTTKNSSNIYLLTSLFIMIHPIVFATILAFMDYSMASVLRSNGGDLSAGVIIYLICMGFILFFGIKITQNVIKGEELSGGIGQAMSILGPQAVLGATALVATKGASLGRTAFSGMMNGNISNFGSNLTNGLENIFGERKATKFAKNMFGKMGGLEEGLNNYSNKWKNNLTKAQDSYRLRPQEFKEKHGSPFTPQQKEELKNYGFTITKPSKWEGSSVEKNITSPSYGNKTHQDSGYRPTQTSRSGESSVDRERRIYGFSLSSSDSASRVRNGASLVDSDANPPKTLNKYEGRQKSFSAPQNETSVERDKRIYGFSLSRNEETSSAERKRNGASLVDNVANPPRVAPKGHIQSNFNSESNNESFDERNRRIYGFSISSPKQESEPKNQSNGRLATNKTDISVGRSRKIRSFVDNTQNRNDD